MINVGHLMPVKYGEQTQYEGAIETLELDLKIKLVPNPYKNDPKHPDFEVHGKAKDRDIKIGVGWQGEKPKPDGSKTHYISFNAEDPSFGALSLVAFKRKASDNWDICWGGKDKPKNDNNE